MYKANIKYYSKVTDTVIIHKHMYNDRGRCKQLWETLTRDNECGELKI